VVPGEFLQEKAGEHRRGKALRGVVNQGKEALLGNAKFGERQPLFQSPLGYVPQHRLMRKDHSLSLEDVFGGNAIVPISLLLYARG
jgi:hypothetical protein